MITALGYRFAYKYKCGRRNWQSLSCSSVLDNYNDYENNGSITGAVASTEGDILSGAGDMVAAFVDGEQRGVARALEGPGFSSYDYVFLMMSYSNENEGETLTFQYYSVSPSFSLL
jgi:hypothetical protein